jgi:hypothetical protein
MNRRPQSRLQFHGRMDPNRAGIGHAFIARNTEKKYD